MLNSARAFLRWRAALAVWALAVLLWALVWTPIWGQWHGITHQVQQVVSAPSDAAVPAQSEPDEGHAKGSALCQVLDHLGHASALNGWSLVAALLWLPAAAPVLKCVTQAGARPWWRAQARAPPVQI